MSIITQRQQYEEPEPLRLTAAEQIKQFRARRDLKKAKRKLRRAIRKQPKLEGDDAIYNMKHAGAMSALVAMLESELP